MLPALSKNATNVCPGGLKRMQHENSAFSDMRQGKVKYTRRDLPFLSVMYNL